MYQEEHRLQPFLPKHAKILMLGSFPPKIEKWNMDFYYPNFQNDMWRILGFVFFHDKEYFLTDSKDSFSKDKICEFLMQKRIAIADVGKKIVRTNNNASDKYLTIVETLDLRKILDDIPYCHAIISTGEKSAECVKSILDINFLPKIGEGVQFLIGEHKMMFYRVPSSSRAYPKSIEYKSFIYKKVFDKI